MKEHCNKNKIRKATDNRNRATGTPVMELSDIKIIIFNTFKGRENKIERFSRQFETTKRIQ